MAALEADVVTALVVALAFGVAELHAEPRTNNRQVSMIVDLCFIKKVALYWTKIGKNGIFVANYP